MENDKNNNDLKNDREGNEMYHFMVKQYDFSKLDRYFSIHKLDGGGYMMGNKRITFDKQSNIYVDGEEYKGTSGLWLLIKMKKLTWDNPKDLDSYAKLVEKTNVKINPKTFEHTRPYTTYKWK